MSFIRAAVGFLFFHVLFFFRDNDYSRLWLGAVAASVTIGAALGNMAAPVLRRSVREELMVAGALAGVALGGGVAAVTGGPLAAALLALLVQVAGAIGRLAFESIVQRDAPGANQGRAFARFEARFQLFWVAAAIVAVVLGLPGRLGFLVVGLIGVFAVVTYLVGSRAVRAGRPIPESLSGKARRTVQREVGRRRDARRVPYPTVPPPIDPPLRHPTRPRR
jgi:hypothetical protein